MSSVAASQRGQAGMLLLGLLLAVVLGAIVLGGIARGVGARGDLQRGADLAALAAARAMHDAYPRVFEPPELDGAPNPRHLERGEYLALGTRAAEATAARNGAHDTRIAFPGGGLAPIRVRVTVRDAIAIGERAEVPNAATAEAELTPSGALPGGGAANAGQYPGPFAYRQRQADASRRRARLRPDFLKPLRVASPFYHYAAHNALQRRARRRAHRFPAAPRRSCSRRRRSSPSSGATSPRHDRNRRRARCHTATLEPPTPT